MTIITRRDLVQTFDSDGNVVEELAVDVDVTADVVTYDLHVKARQALAANATFLALPSPTNAQVVAQVQRLTRECTALIKLMLDDLADTAGT